VVAGSCATGAREPGQDRKVAAFIGIACVPQIAWSPPLSLADSVWNQHLEGCESGRIGTLGKRVNGNIPWVRIPPSPPRTGQGPDPGRFVVVGGARSSIEQD